MIKLAGTSTFSKMLGLAFVLAFTASVAEAQTAINHKNAIYPITLTKSGPYKLTSHLVVPEGKDGIVLAPGVDAVIDMNGFSISGPADCGRYTECYQFNGTVGIRVQEHHTVRVFNGRVSGFTRAAIGEPGHYNYSQVVAENVRVLNNASGLSAYTVMAKSVLAYDNAGVGIYGQTGVVVDSISNFNLVDGIAISSGSVRGCVASSNGRYGFMFQRVTNQDNVAYFNGEAQASGVSAHSPSLNNNYN